MPARRLPLVRGLVLVAAVLLAALAVACTDDAEAPEQPPEPPPPTATPEPARPTTLTVITHDSFDVSEGLIEQFEREHNAKVELIAGGDANEVVNRAILNAGNPEGDVLFGRRQPQLHARRGGWRVRRVRGRAAW